MFLISWGTTGKLRFGITSGAVKSLFGKGSWSCSSWLPIRMRKWQTVGPLPLSEESGPPCLGEGFKIGSWKPLPNSLGCCKKCNPLAYKLTNEGGRDKAKEASQCILSIILLQVWVIPPSLGKGHGSAECLVKCVSLVGLLAKGPS